MDYGSIAVKNQMNKIKHINRNKEYCKITCTLKTTSGEDNTGDIAINVHVMNIGGHVYCLNLFYISRLKTYLFTQYFLVLTRVVHHPITWYLLFSFYYFPLYLRIFNPIMCKAPIGIRIWRYIKSVFIIIIII